MSKLITLDEYFNIIGREMFSDWSEDTVYYFSERKKELKKFGERARKVYSIAINRIWGDGNVKVSMRLEQGYIDPPFAIVEFYFAQSGCISKDGGFYRCRLEVNKNNRGRPKQYSREEIDDIIREYVKENHFAKDVPLSDISHAAVISYVLEFLKRNAASKIPSHGTIGNRLKKIFPECKKDKKDSNK